MCYVQPLSISHHDCSSPQLQTPLFVRVCARVCLVYVVTARSTTNRSADQTTIVDHGNKTGRRVWGGRAHNSLRLACFGGRPRRFPKALMKVVAPVAAWAEFAAACSATTASQKSQPQCNLQIVLKAGTFFRFYLLCYLQHNLRKDLLCCLPINFSGVPAVLFAVQSALVIAVLLTARLAQPPAILFAAKHAEVPAVQSEYSRHSNLLSSFGCNGHRYLLLVVIVLKPD